MAGMLQRRNSLFEIVSVVFAVKTNCAPKEQNFEGSLSPIGVPAPAVLIQSYRLANARLCEGSGQ